MCTFKFDYEWVGTLLSMDADVRHQVVDAILWYVHEGKEPEGLPLVGEVTFKTIQRKLKEREVARRCMAKKRGGQSEGRQNKRQIDGDGNGTTPLTVNSTVSTLTVNSTVSQQLTNSYGKPDVEPISGEVVPEAPDSKEKREEKERSPLIIPSKEREGKREKVLAVSLSLAPSSSVELRAGGGGEDPIVARMLLNTGETEDIRASEKARWCELFPAVDVAQELRSMMAWLEANPKNRKTKRGIRRFITSWLSRSQDRARKEPRRPAYIDKTALMDDFITSAQESGVIDYAFRMWNNSSDHNADSSVPENHDSPEYEDVDFTVVPGDRRNG